MVIGQNPKRKGRSLLVGFRVETAQGFGWLYKGFTASGFCLLVVV